MASLRILRSSTFSQLFTKRMSTETSTSSQTSKLPVALRTSESDPTNHTNNDIGKLYTMPDEVRKKVFPPYTLPLYYERFMHTFNESSIIIRQPALELIDYLKRADYNRPINRYALYGRYGCGKTMTLVHALNYAANNNFVIVHIPSVWKWFHWSREVVSVEREPELLDLPLDGSTWLKSFELCNADLITKLDLRASQTYEWTQRERTLEGAPLIELVIYGITRVKFSCQVIDALLKELKLHSNNKKCKTFIAIDGYNGFFQTSSRLKTAERVFLVPANVSLTKSFLSLVKNDWINGAAVLVIDDHASVVGEYHSHFPFHLLRKIGVESIDPFIPINVPEYSPLEFHNYLDYFEEKLWLQTPGIREEIDFITQRNPRFVNTYCANR